MFRSLMPFGRPIESGSADNPIVSLQRQVNSLFEDMFHGIPVFSRTGGSVFEPSMDVKETDKAIEVEAELPGVDQKDVQVTVEDGTLTVKGEKKVEKEESRAGYYMSERHYGSFFRSIGLPPGVDMEKISADFANGVLKVTLPKVPEAQTKVKKIEVKAGKQSG